MNDSNSLSSDRVLPTGHELLWYVIEEVLGRGGFGITYLARDQNLGRNVALKEYMPGDYARRQDDQSVVPRNSDAADIYNRGLASFMKEAQTLARFKHPNIVQVQTVFEQHGTAYMAMEYENGESLATVLRKNRPPIEQSYFENLLFPIIDGLQLVHDAGFLHRDIKPSNIYLRNDGTPVLIDFGSSRQAEVLNSGDATVLVTKGYTPLEQYSRGYGDQGPWTDIYAIAASIYYAVCGKVPADAIERDAFSRSGHPDAIKSFSSLTESTFSLEFETAIDTALNLLPMDRPQTLREWRTMFEEQDDRTVLYQAKEPSASLTIPTELPTEPPTEPPSHQADVVLNADSQDEWATPVISVSDKDTDSARPRSSRTLLASAAVLAGAIALGGWWFASGKTTVAPNSVSQSADDITTALPQPDSPIKLVSPVDRITNEVDSLSRALDLYNKAVAAHLGSSDIRVAIESIAKRFYALATTRIVRANKTLREKVAAGLVASAGVTVENRDLLAQLVRLSSETTADKRTRLQNWLDSTPETMADRESLVYELAALSIEQKNLLNREKQITTLMARFAESITRQIHDSDFDKAARMTEVALLVQPSNRRLMALAEHLESGGN